MRRQLTGLTLVLVGLVALSFGLTLGLAPTPAAAKPALQPWTRPTLVPTAEPSGDGTPKPAAPGRITGTVIDVRTGAPVSGQQVLVGDTTLTSDSAGNYEVWRAPGQYLVSLVLGPDAGTVAQTPTLATVWGSDTVVVHLFFTSPAPLSAATATALPLPTPAPLVAVLPGDLPDSSVAAKPVSLPVTGNELLDPQSLVLGGLALLALGASLLLLPRRAPARVGASAPRRRRRRSAQELLEDLLRRDP